MRGWVFDKEAVKGEKLSSSMKSRVENRIQSYALTKYAGKQLKVSVRFRGRYCYIDTIEAEGCMPLVRLLYQGREDEWELALFTYSDERYSRCLFGSGKPLGCPEEALDVGALYFE